MNSTGPIESTEPVAGSFRDPSGFVFRRGGVVYRQINRSYQAEYEKLMAGGLYKKLVGAGWLVEHEEVAERPADESCGPFKVIRPKQLGGISYPYEWAFSALKDAALLTLDVQSAAMDAGMTLKDASAYNVQLEGGRPIFIDTLSFEALPESEPWVAYGQFCRHFVAPLALMAKVDVRLGQLLRVHVDGIPLDLAAGLLPGRTKWNLGLGLHIHAHARSQKKHEGVGAAGGSGAKLKLSAGALKNLILGLRGTVEGLVWNAPRTEWGDYYESNNNYSGEGLAEKERLVGAWVGEFKPARVWDLGGNVGRFSRIAKSTGAGNVTCWDIDPLCVEAAYRRLREDKSDAFVPLLLDLNNPSPALGWAGAERESLAQRGGVELVMALGLIHHLAISNNVPLASAADYFASLGRNLLIEFVPREDSQVKKLLATRKDIFPSYTREGFEAAFSPRFEIQTRTEIAGTLRTLYLMRKRGMASWR